MILKPSFYSIFFLYSFSVLHPLSVVDMLVMSNHLLYCIKSLCLGVQVGREGVNSDLHVFLPIWSICKCCVKCFYYPAIRLSICRSESAVLWKVNLLGLNQFPKPEIIHHPLQPRATLIREESLLAHQSLEFSQSISLEFSESITLEGLNRNGRENC